MKKMIFTLFILGIVITFGLLGSSFARGRHGGYNYHHNMMDNHPVCYNNLSQYHHNHNYHHNCFENEESVYDHQQKMFKRQNQSQNRNDLNPPNK